MADLIVSLLPLALGIVMSPLAIMALVAVLLSRRARANGIAFLTGWVSAVALAVGGSFWVLGLLDLHDVGTPPVWVALVRLLLGLLLLAGAGWVYRKGTRHARRMAAAETPAQVTAAAPQLPGWLRSVETFTPARSFALGLGIFLLNPIDLSCAVLAALDTRLAALAPTTDAVVLIAFGVASVLPIVLPVVLVLVRREAAAPVLARVRTWIASHTSVLNAALVLVIAVLQLQKAVSALLSS
ncbi:GAP family protein [Microbacterium sp. NPDC089189]|uniref:GAP family protein n=1 Tax=Microbacterium sp. NPDC089189 TaxID=3154972 RepID=UPI00343DC38C